MKFLTRFIINIIIILGLTACATTEETTATVANIETSSPFVQVEGLNFIKDGKPYHFLGTNLWYGANLAAEGQRERLLQELDELKLMGIENLRVVGASEGAGDSRIRKSFQPQLGVYDEEMLVGLDFLLSEMGKRDMTAVIFLNNYWVWTGGMSQYMAWVNGTEVPNPFLPQYEWNDFMRYSATFYSSNEAISAHQNYMDQLLNRTNTITGKPYIDDPAIMSWQLANEPRPGNDASDSTVIAAYIKWVDQTARYIKAHDPNHLVSTGNEGLAGSVWLESAYRDAHKLDHIDYMTFHLWIKNWGWYDANNPEETYPEANRKALDYIDQHLVFAAKLGKPITLEEFGIPRDEHSYSIASSTEWRDKYYADVFEALYQNALAGGAAAGSNFWGWGGKGIPDTDDEHWAPGDDFVGDPPQEPQGLNSVFSTDSTTVNIIRNYTRMMNAIQ